MSTQICIVTLLFDNGDDNKDDDGDDMFQATETNESSRLVYKFPNTRASSIRTIMIASCGRDTSHDSDRLSPLRQCVADSGGDSNCRHKSLDCGDVSRDQLLIFTKGSWTYTPHQIGIKRMPRSVDRLLSEQQAHDADIETEDDADDDSVDESVDLHGHIIGMNLSPDHRSAPSVSLSHIIGMNLSPDHRSAPSVSLSHIIGMNLSPDHRSAPSVSLSHIIGMKLSPDHRSAPSVSLSYQQVSVRIFRDSKTTLCNLVAVPSTTKHFVT